MSKLVAVSAFCVAVSASAQPYNKEVAEVRSRLSLSCLANIAPLGGKVRKDPFMLDVAKELCLCVSDALLAERSILSGESTPGKEHRFLQITLQCKDQTFNKREPEALASFNKEMAARNLPPVSRFPWHYWFEL